MIIKLFFQANQDDLEEKNLELKVLTYQGKIGDSEREKYKNYRTRSTRD